MKKRKPQQKYSFTCSTCRNKFTTTKVKAVEEFVNGELHGRARCPKCKITRKRKLKKEV